MNDIKKAKALLHNGNSVDADHELQRTRDIRIETNCILESFCMLYEKYSKLSNTPNRFLDKNFKVRLIGRSWYYRKIKCYQDSKLFLQFEYRGYGAPRRIIVQSLKLKTDWPSKLAGLALALRIEVQALTHNCKVANDSMESQLKSAKEILP